MWGGKVELVLLFVLLFVAIVQGGRLRVSFGVFLAKFLMQRRQLVTFLVNQRQP